MSSRPSKRRRVTPPPEDGQDSGNGDVKVQKAFFKSASNWNLEQTYETKSKKAKKKEAKKNGNETGGRLPVKTAQGTWQVHDDAESVASDGDWLESEADDGGIDEEPEAVVPEAPKIPEREQILKAQEELAKIATQLNEDPEEYPGAFKSLARIGDSPIPAIQKLCIVTQMTVYKDVIPGYRIRPASEEAEKLSKDVKRLRTYEQALVSGYQGYIKTLARHASSTATGSRRLGQPVSSIAFTCACTLVNAVPHFNFRGELLRILVKKLSGRQVDENFNKCLKALETLFRDDEEGNASQEAVSLLSKMMKARDYRVDESVLNLFLHLRLLSEFSGKASQDSVSRPSDLPNGKKPKVKKEFRTKRERKLMKQQKEADKVMAHADAAVSHEEREKTQSEILKMVFANYFRILKARMPHLMGAVLEGLAKYAHLINQNFFGDLLEALKDLIRDSEFTEEGGVDGETNGNEEDDELSVIRDTSREALLCTVTAFALLEGQDAHNARSDLHLDLSFFITNLYRSLLSLSVNADVELGAKSLHLADPEDSSSGNPANRKTNKVNLQTTTVLLLRCLTGVLLPPWNIRSVPPLRLAAFTKQLMSVALQVPEKSSEAVLGVVHDVVHTHGRKINALWNTEERKGDGTYKPLAETIEGSNPFTTTIWEGELLRKHYCPKDGDVPGGDMWNSMTFPHRAIDYQRRRDGGSSVCQDSQRLTPGGHAARYKDAPGFMPPLAEPPEQGRRMGTQGLPLRRMLRRPSARGQRSLPLEPAELCRDGGNRPPWQRSCLRGRGFRKSIW
ncbi:nucleolar complex-associated protein-domain-containing protein [Chaetomium tenue]|uniref:Nucleolar complex-associated protein-domain-containing protein n=1 Tax=Chaetomium tenue TaxID=1854479 RepID=A0ACB7PBT2_9PEZI|nr:nucleolar complex-associated protein-domain-containing protein [Chaetomium globosum]